ncbi:hypothetical protein BDQ17DRAFT_1540177 [Cyathus striatus]|nr:hypothetical protein BDQ17DRAFT_1540177 [Cyathus striatus]
MGIGSTVKNMFADTDANEPLSSDAGNIISSQTNAPHDSGLATDPGQVGNSVRSRQQLPADATVAGDVERSRDFGISGLGTDASAAQGGSLATSHEGSTAQKRSGGFGTDIRDSRADIKGDTVPQRSATFAGVRETDTAPRTATTTQRSRTINAPLTSSPPTVDTSASAVTARPAGGVLETHTFGHSKITSEELTPSGDTDEDTNQLNPVTHERIRHIETEEVERVKDRHRHIHHVQHHIQPIIVSEELAEQIHEKVHPVTNIREKHANKAEDNVLFNNQIKQQHDTMEHLPTERRVIDKGTVINEYVHHHIHHVIQPVIQKETIDKQRIRTTIPIREITDEAPVVHQSQTHAPVPIEHFLNRGGALKGAVSQEQVTNKVLHGGHCTREVDGIADNLTRSLGLTEQTTNASGTRTVNDKVRGDITATTGVPDSATHAHAPAGVDMRTSHRPVHVSEIGTDQPIAVGAT